MNNTTIKILVAALAVNATALLVLPTTQIVYAAPGINAQPDDNSFDAPNLNLKKPEKAKEIKANEAILKDAEAFFEARAPKHYAAYNRYLQRGKGLHPNLRNWIISSYTDLRAIENADPKLYAVKLDELKIQDEIFGKVAEARGASEKKKLKDDLKPLIKDLLEKKKQASALRIEKLKSMIQNEEKFLSIDPGDDQVISAKAEEEILRGIRLFSPPNERRATTTSIPD